MGTPAADMAETLCFCKVSDACLRQVRRQACLDVQKEEDQALEQARQLLRELPHHAGRLLARLAQRHQELCRQLPGAVFQLCGFRYLHTQGLLSHS